MGRAMQGAAVRQSHLPVRNKWRSAIALGLLLASSSAFANFTCEGKVTYLGLSPDGLLTMSVGGFGVWYICSPTTANPASGFTPEGCRAWYAGVLAAQKADHSIVFFFSSPASTGNGPECTALGSWTWPSPLPYHMGIRGY